MPGTNRVGLGSQLNFSLPHSISAQVAEIGRLLYSSFWVAPEKTQASDNLALPGDLRASTPNRKIKRMPKYHQTTSTCDMGWTQQILETC